MSTKSTTKESPPEKLTADQISSQMEQYRLEFDSEVEQFVKGANALGDWKQYVKASPLLAFAACAVVGFLVVPRTKSKNYINADPEMIANLVRRDKLVVAPPQKVKRSEGLVSGLTGSILRIGMQTAAGAVMAKLGEKATPTDGAKK